MDRPEMQDLDGYLLDCLKIEPLALQEEFVRVVPDIAYWNEKYVVAHKANLLAKAELARVKSHLWLLKREQAKAAGGKGPTVDDISSSVEVDETFQAAQLAAIEAEAERARLYGVLDTIRTKKDMLQSIGAHVRAEMASDPMVRRDFQEQAVAARENNTRG